jgi:hypothetical protein
MGSQSKKSYDTALTIGLWEGSAMDVGGSLPV